MCLKDVAKLLEIPAGEILERFPARIGTLYNPAYNVESLRECGESNATYNV